MIACRQFLVVLACLALLACASGSALLTGTKRPPITEDQVTLYLEPPKSYETIGLVNASSDSGWTEQGSLNYAVAELKRQAAKLGANGVLIMSTGDSTSAIVSSNGAGGIMAIPVTAKTVQGRAIHVDSGQ